MNSSNEKNIHPGIYVKRHIIPEGMTITKAAELLGIGRPALSNFLNGKASLSPDMATRLESTFGADREHLLNLQTKLTSKSTTTHEQPIITGTHAPALFEIRALQIENWADDIEARQELAALLRRQIHSTGQNLTLVDFPAYDNAERHGWDGLVETSTPTPWIPVGKSGWEFGCNQNPRSKAEADYETRIKSIPPEERADLTFVFVTPRNWRGKQTWVEEKDALGHWKDVRAYDASDLEQWLEQSAPTQIWFAERLSLPGEGYRSLDKCWSDWASVCEQELSPALFEPAVKQFSKEFKNWLENPPDRPFIIAADSRDEALAFVSCLIKHAEIITDKETDRTIVLDTTQALQKFGRQTSIPIIAIIHDPEVEKESGGLHRRCHCIIARPRNDVNIQPDITLELLGGTDFQKALEIMGFPHDKIERLARESACSPTILRRRLSVIPAIRTPEWAENEGIAQKLLPAVMAGAWHDASTADREVMRLLADTDGYSEIENNLAALLDLEDSPLWAIGEYRGVVSRIDALFAIAGFITKSNLENFFLVAEYVLAEKDPAIDLPENEQWMAPVYGKVRNHSDALRSGIRETLILLAIYGNHLFFRRLGFCAQQHVSELIKKLLLPLDRETILSHNHDLPDYAEAAPEDFLELLEADLGQSKPVILELMRPVKNVFMGGPRRTELLWALEGIAWSPQHFPRVVNILAKLCLVGESEATDNWVNTPENTLQSLFCCLLPQTAASIEQRKQALSRIAKQNPNLGWALCIKHLDWPDSIATPNHQPRWRDDAEKINHEVQKAEHKTDHFEFNRNVIKLVLNWPQHDEKTLGDLVQRLECFSIENQQQIWDIIDQWASQITSEDAKALLRLRIQGCAHGRHIRKRSIAHPEREREASEKLLPKDLLIRHEWLFKSNWVELPPDQTEDDEFSYEKNEQRRFELRVKALHEIWEEHSFRGVSALLEKIRAEADIVGNITKEILKAQCEKIEFVKSCLHMATGDNEFTYKACLAEFLWNANADFIEALIKEIEQSLGEKALLKLLLCLPYGAATWQWLDDRSKTFQEDYWKYVKPRTWMDTPGEEINETINKLLEVNRAPEAFKAVCMMLEKVETSKLTRLLNALPTFSLEHIHNHVFGGNFGHYISKSFDVLDKRSGVSVEEKARLEFAYLPLLEQNDYAIPNLEKIIAKSPELYAQAIACSYKRDDREEDPPEFRATNLEEQKKLVSNAFYLLRFIKRIPGSDDQSNIDTGVLNNWLNQVRNLCAQYGRAKIGDHKIGQLLARGHAPKDDYSVWPSRPICEALEWMASTEVRLGFNIGTQNTRGTHWKGEGGDQERNLAARYRDWAQKLVYEFPFVAGLLEDIAKSYDHQAGWEDNQSDLRRRLPFQ